MSSSERLQIQKKAIGRHNRESGKDTPKAFRKTVQIATVGDDAEGVLAGA